MKVLCLYGSPRVKGNSATVANYFLDSCKDKGAEIESFVLNKLNYRGCQGCMTCKTKLERCVLKDDLEQVLDAVRDADILVLSSPIYYADITSQLKGFIDRTFSYLVPDFFTSPNPCRLKPDKKLLMILSQAQADDKLFADVYPKYEMFFKWYGFKNTQVIRACGVNEPGDAKKREDLIQKVKDIAKLMIE
ncbi:MAG: flavodoxin family protein [Desulfobacterales bacterium]|nr:flavodoxin family protein [Desulfobacterales bacterium]MBF0396952.1 flavodoxin family protein [Desulfobacterales bacterium]